MKTELNTVKARTSLKPKRDPYWHRLSKGQFLGFRKMSKGNSGTWLARMLDATTGKQEYHPLGDLGELPDHERYDAAKKAAEAWFTHRGAGGALDAITVGVACDRLVQKYRNESREAAAKDVEGRFKRWVHSNKKFASTPVTKLTAGILDKWRTDIAKTPATHQDKKVKSDKARSPATLNRDMAVLKTALNLAKEDGYATSDHAWVVKLKPVKDATGRRDVYLDADQRRKLIQHAAKDVAVLIRAMALLPLRPGAVAALTVGNFDKRLNSLTVGKDKAGQDRKITLPASTAAFFNEQAKDKLPSAPLFARADGAAWNKDSWKYPFKAAVIAAELPTAATAYALRHSTITDLVTKGLDTMTVSQLAGTSIAMIEKHYGHHRAAHATKALEGLAL